MQGATRMALIAGSSQPVFPHPARRRWFVRHRSPQSRVHEPPTTENMDNSGVGAVREPPLEFVHFDSGRSALNVIPNGAERGLGGVGEGPPRSDLSAGWGAFGNLSRLCQDQSQASALHRSHQRPLCPFSTSTGIGRAGFASKCFPEPIVCFEDTDDVGAAIARSAVI